LAFRYKEPPIIREVLSLSVAFMQKENTPKIKCSELIINNNLIFMLSKSFKKTFMLSAGFAGSAD
jgi:hypothetical protein